MEIIIMREIFEIVWNRIVTNAGSVFYTKLEKTFSYKIEDGCFIPLRPDKAPKVTKEYVRMAYNQWPVSGPSGFTDNILAPSYLWGIFNDNRIINTEEKS